MRLLFFLALLSLFAGQASAREPTDPLAADIARWSDALEKSTSTDPLWMDTKKMTAPAIAAARAALAAGQRGLALYELASVRLYLSGAELAGKRPARERKDMGALEKAWKRSGKTLAPELAPAEEKTFASLSPAIVRAVAEVAYPQVRNYYFAGVDYAHNTNAEAGFFYLGLAHGQAELMRLCRSLPPTAAAGPALHSLDAELDALKSELLAAYHPPAAIDRHRDFIEAGSVLKEARELDAAGLREGALLRYLEAVAQVAKLRPDAPKPDPAALHDIETRLADTSVDHSIGRTILEEAKTGKPEALAIATAVTLPRYFAALEAPKPRPPAPAPEVTVTMVRWPYT